MVAQIQSARQVVGGFTTWSVVFPLESGVQGLHELRGVCWEVGLSSSFHHFYLANNILNRLIIPSGLHLS